MLNYLKGLHYQIYAVQCKTTTNGYAENLLFYKIDTAVLTM